MINTMIQELKDHLENTSPIQLEKEWDEVKEFGSIDPKAWDFIEMQKRAHERMKMTQKEIRDTVINI